MWRKSAKSRNAALGSSCPGRGVSKLPARQQPADHGAQRHRWHWLVQQMVTQRAHCTQPLGGGVAADEEGGKRRAKLAAQPVDRFDAILPVGEAIIGNDQIGPPLVVGQTGQCRAVHPLSIPPNSAKTISSSSMTTTSLPAVASSTIGGASGASMLFAGAATNGTTTVKREPLPSVEVSWSR